MFDKFKRCEDLFDFVYRLFIRFFPTMSKGEFLVEVCAFTSTLS
jgi:hypothetical protein